MTATNSHVNGSATTQPDGRSEPASTAAMFMASTGAQLTAEKIKELVTELEVPFNPAVIEWRVTNTSKGNGNPRGQVIPYADQRAYTDRLNALTSPAGWTRKYTVHTSANFQRGKDQKTVAKVFVTCELTVFGLGSHSATGEEWADDDNAGTSAEAQAFKRACSCFGLGRYLYYFSGEWVDLDDRKRPKWIPNLPKWATPEGWRQGQRPEWGGIRQSSKPAAEVTTRNGNHSRRNEGVPTGEHTELVRQVEAMAEPLGRGIYRGVLKKVARVWKPSQVHDVALLQKVLAQMQGADRGLHRLDAALDKTGPDQLAVILRSVNLKSLDQVDNLETLQKVVLALEAKAGSTAFHVRR